MDVIVVLFILIGIPALLGLIPANIAAKKGRSFGLWWFYGAVIFIVALPHSILAQALPGSDEDVQREREKRAALSAVDFVADGVIADVPYRREFDGGIVAQVGGRTIRFKDMKDLETMVAARRPGA